MFENELLKCIEKAKFIRKKSLDDKHSGFFIDSFPELTMFINKSLASPLFKWRHAKIIAKHMDQILPFIVYDNLFLMTKEELVNQPEFKKKFREGLTDYPYKDEMIKIFKYLEKGIDCLLGTYLDESFLNLFASLNLKKDFYSYILDELNENKQKKFLNKLFRAGLSFDYLKVIFRGNNKQLFYDNVSKIINKVDDLYDLMVFVRGDTKAYNYVKNYIDTHEDETINSIIRSSGRFAMVTDSSLKEVIKLIITDVARVENIKLSDIMNKSGGYSKVLFIGDKVVKIGSRHNKSFPNNPYIVTPLLRKNLNINGESCFVEVTERVQVAKNVEDERIYQLYKSIRKLGLIWTDVERRNVGILKKDNIRYWKEDINPSDEVLGFNGNRSDIVLKKGDLVVLDADYIYDEEESKNKIIITPGSLFVEFERRYQREKQDNNKPIIR